MKKSFSLIIFSLFLSFSVYASPKKAQWVSTSTTSPLQFDAHLQLVAVHIDGSYGVLNRIGIGAKYHLGSYSLGGYIAGAVEKDNGNVVGQIGPQILFGLPIPLSLGAGWDLIRIGPDGGFDSSKRAYYFTLSGPLSLELLSLLSD